MKSRLPRLVLWACWLALAAACGKQSDVDEKGPAMALDLADQSCDSCGMIVREQSAPRGQLVHRDGTRGFFCSIADLLVYLEAPSPHGKVVATFVESLDAAADPLEFATAARPWVRAESASYVLGVDKERVMGTPVLVYETEEAARGVAAGHNASFVVSWRELRARMAQK